MKKSIALTLALGLAACATDRTPTTATTAPSPATQLSRLETGNLQGECGKALGKYQTVIDNDLATGHVNRTVYNRIINDLSGAASICAAGNGGAALSQLAAIKSRYGYPQ